MHIDVRLYRWKVRVRRSGPIIFCSSSLPGSLADNGNLVLERHERRVDPTRNLTGNRRSKGVPHSLTRNGCSCNPLSFFSRILSYHALVISSSLFPRSQRCRLLPYMSGLFSLFLKNTTVVPSCYILALSVFFPEVKPAFYDTEINTDLKFRPRKGYNSDRKLPETTEGKQFSGDSERQESATR